jgi:acetyltransferase-like isoleucine patch superfamily enzyme
MLWNWLRGLALLRHPELIRDLGERRFHLQRIASLEQRFPGCKIDRDIILIGYAPAQLQLGQKVTLSAGTILAFGDQLNGFGKIAIGTGTWIGQYNNLRAGGGDITIGAGCLISQFCTLVASNHGTARDLPIQQQPPQEGRRGVTLEDDVWLGAGVTITPGVTVYRGAVIGAGSVVTRDVPAFEIHAGIPAIRIGTRATKDSAVRQNDE